MSDPSRIEELAQRAADGLADEAIIVELEALMREDPSARITYLQTLQLHQDLERKAARGTLSEEPVPVELPMDLPATSSRRRGPVLTVAAALVLAVAAYFMWPSDQGGVGEIDERQIATITRLDQVDEPLTYHQGFRPGDRVTIKSGFLELTYQSGVRLVLQGPVDYTLEDAERGRLELGSLGAEVPPDATGFTVVTPSAEVKDIGTRFAVALLDTGRTEFEVFEGEVQAQSAMTGSAAKSFRTGQTAAIDDGETEVQPIPTTPDRFQGVHDALNRRTVEAVADRFVQGGKFADQVPIDGPDVLLLKHLGASNDVARKIWIRFDLAGQSVNLHGPATLTLHTTKAPSRASWDVALYGLKADFEPGQGVLDIAWQENSLTWNNAPGNDVDSHVKMSSAAALIATGKIRLDPENKPAGSFFTYTIPSLEPFLQEDGTVTLMLLPVTGGHRVLNFAAREHEEFPGPMLTFETQEQNVN